ncbi:YlbL family protein [Aeromicrobium wangtongii]|uniref:endopeptidase La n=1 Tax=Aeromicrobium wangtongii TaxID=2969247 RepID=A0ABY5M428_9ACTN|nr:PDZ domain-containing protein [Aeromicrobium wangtongii]MCD9199050.1 PDZ domain-containing protein [Aeromicrobium wangtongii]UUP12919.1 PDZ domain-containing protein [Aeromicrobium wangtongii]
MSDPARLSRRYSTMVVATISLVVLTCVAYLIPVPYVTMRPGPAFNTLGTFDGKPVFSFGAGVKTYPTTGALDFTTVSVSPPDAKLSLADAVRAYFERDVAVVPRSLRYPDDESAKQSNAEAAAQLDSSKDASTVAALRAAGYTVTARPQVDSVVKDGPAAAVLKAGDIITSVNGTKVASARDAVTAIAKVKPGDPVDIGIERDGKDQSFDIVTRPDEADPAVPRIGIALGTKYTYPIEITNNVGGNVGGPSAGSMFALAIYDQLTPGQLTGGKKIAGTGEITADGVVGAIGGVRQKMRGAANAGASIFLVPAANCAEATDGDDDGLTLVKITKLDDAISSLEALAKNPDAKVPACS